MASLANMVAHPIAYARDARWESVFDPSIGLLVEERAAPVPAANLDQALDALDCSLSFAGALADLPPTLAALPDDLSADIRELATRFAALLGVPAIRLRLERIETDACRKWHQDYTDLRLVVTYRGPGTQFRLSAFSPIEQIGEQQVALFKGREFDAAHALIEHRSPPIAGTGVRRLVLVIDTPLKTRDAAFELASQ